MNLGYDEDTSNDPSVALLPKKLPDDHQGHRELPPLREELDEPQAWHLDIERTRRNRRERKGCRPVALVLHYLEDWTAPLAELRRVLRPGGRLIMAVNHPMIFKLIDPTADYFATVKWSQEHTFNGQEAVLTYWHRPLHAMTDAFTASGFRTAVISEPPAAPEARELFPDDMARFPSGAFVGYLFFVLEAV